MNRNDLKKRRFAEAVENGVVKIAKLFVRSTAAGAAIGLGGYAALLADGGLVGATLFSAGLIIVLACGLPLYTGRVGRASSWNLKEPVVLAGNFVGAALVAELCRNAATERALFDGCFDSRTAIGAGPFFVESILCGALVWAAVESYRETKSFVPVVFCVATFVFCGFEHCVADAFYLSIDNPFATFANDGKYLALAVAGNATGAVVMSVWTGRFFER